MTTPNDVVLGQEPVLHSPPPLREEEMRADSLFQEINERRARVENSELLRNLRSL